MAVMTTQQSEGALLAEKPLHVTTLAPEKEALDSAVDVNGHSSPNKSEHESESVPAPKDTESVAPVADTKPVEQEKAVLPVHSAQSDKAAEQSEESPGKPAEMKEEVAPAKVQPEPEDVKMEGSSPADTDMPDAPPQASTTEDKSSKEEIVPESQPAPAPEVAPEAHIDTKSEPKPEPELKDEPKEEAETTAKDTPAAEAVPLDEAVSPKTVAVSNPNPDKDVVMGDAHEPAADPTESTQETAVSDIPPVTPSIEGNDAPIKSAETADSSMSESVQPPAKVSRDRDIDSEDEPVAKRTKVDHSAEAAQTKKAQNQDRMDVDLKSLPGGPTSLYDSNGNPKLLDDPTLDNNPITEWQSRQIRQVLAGVKKTKVGLSFRQPVQTLWPMLWPEYSARVSNPVDISSMERRLRGDNRPYITLGDFKADLELLVDNSVSFNGPIHEVTKQAKACRDAILGRMHLQPAVEPAKPERKDFVKQHPTRHAEPRAPAPPAAAAAAAAAPAPAPVPRPPKVASPAPKQQPPVENPAFAIPAGNNGVPLIRRDSTKGDSRTKRPLKPAHSRDLPYDTKRKKKLPPELRFCDEVLTELKKSKHFDINGPFIQPVDPVALNIPSYHKVVKKPMDLATMTTKLHAGDYTSIKDFDRDFDLIIKNCKLFNGEGHVVYEQAKRLQGLYRTEMLRKDDWLAKHAPPAAVASPHHKDETDEDDVESEDDADDEHKAIQGKIAGFQRRLQEEQNKINNLINSGTADIAEVEVAQSLVAMLQKSLMAERAKLAGLPPKKSKPSKASKPKKPSGGSHGTVNAKKAAVAGSGGGSSGAPKKSVTKKPAPKRKITPAEKDVVTTYLGELDGPYLERAIDLIKKDTGQGENPDGELELDIESLSDDALVKIYDIVCRAYPQAKVVKHEKVHAQAAADPPTNKNKASATKSKKNKPMSKSEQERRIQQLNELRAQATRQASGSQEPMESIEGTGAAPAEPLAQSGLESDEEADSEEE
ncbi:Bromodomain-containing factor 1 [Cladorrhinum samala]|uniref:Bromodomain-containing factor 1 n=1 Tax=Cladorrhinum samala TaxID=585594 RepID=A0AAV9HJH7_9PEZI|nr:Bromodomain-containing factor 1 [Cladorrhinum samala]